MRFKEAYGGSKERGFSDAAAKLACPDSGQVDEPLSPPRVTKRCRKRGKGNSSTVPWGIGWRIVKQILTFSR